MARNNEDFNSGMSGADDALSDLARRLENIALKGIEASASEKELQTQVESLTNQVADLNKQLADYERRISSSGDIKLFEQLQRAAKKAADDFNAFRKTVGLSMDSLSDLSVTDPEHYKRTINDIYQDVVSGAKSYIDAVTEVKSDFSSLLRDQQSVGIDATAIQGVISSLDGVVKTVETLASRFDALATNGKVASDQMEHVAQPGSSDGLKEVVKTVSALSDGSTAAIEPLTKLAEQLTALTNVSPMSLSNLATAFRSLSEVGQGTFSDNKTKQISALVTELQRISGAGFSGLNINLSGLADIKIDQRKVEKMRSLADIVNDLSKSASALNGINIQSGAFDGLSALFQVDPSGGINNLKINKAALQDLAMFIPSIKEIDGNSLAILGELFKIDPQNGINTLKVSKASLSNLKEYLPAIANVNVKKLKEIFDINTAGINSLKVSKASVENVANLARAADILRTNGIDLSLKGDAIEEINKLTQETVDAADAAKNLRDNLEEVGHADSANKSLERTSDLLGGITVELKQFNDESKLTDINRALKWEGVDKQSREQLLSIFKDMEGSITSVQAKWKDFGVNNEHISQVLIKGVDDVGRAFSRVVNWKQEADKETGNVDLIAEQTDTIQYAIAQEEKLVEIDGRLADVTVAKKKAQDAYNNAIEAGVKSGELNQMKNLIGSYEMLEDAIKKGGVAQNDYTIFMSNAASKSRLLTSVLREQTAALKEQETEMVNSKAASLELQNAQLKIQGVIDKALSNGVTEDNEALRGLIDMRDWFSLLEEEIQRVGMSQENYDYALENSAAEIQLYSKQLGFAIQLNRQEAAAAKEAAKAEAARVNQTQARGAITTERGRVSGIINNATGSGLSDQDANLQSLVTYTNLLDILESELESANLTQKEFNTIMGNLKSIFKEPEIAVKNLTKALKEQQAHIAKSASVYKDIEKACQDYAKAAESTDANVRGAYDGIKKLSSILDNAGEKLRAGTMTGEQYDSVLKDTSASLQEYRKVLDEAGYGTDQMSSKFAALAQQLTRFITPLYLARKAWQTIKDMANVVIELEDAFAQLQIVTGATDKELEEFYDTAANIAATLGKSITDIAASIEVFSRLGYSLPDATTLAQYATVLSNVASVSTDEATTGLTSIIKGYNMHVEQAEHVSDVLVDIGQKYAVSAGEMMEAYERAGAALAATNTSFDKSAALIAAANAAIQNSSTVGKVLPMHTVMYA